MDKTIKNTELRDYIGLQRHCSRMCNKLGNINM